MSWVMKGVGAGIWFGDCGPRVRGCVGVKFFTFSSEAF